MRPILSFIPGDFPKAFFLLCLALLLASTHPLLLFGNDRTPEQKTIRHVLILHSYHPGDAWTDNVMAGMREVLDRQSGQIHLHVEYLDTQRNPNPAYFSDILDILLHYKLENRPFDLVLLSDSDALKVALKHRDDLFAGTPIVFCGVHAESLSMVSGYRDITGVVEHPSFRETIEAALRLHPGTKEIVVIGGTRTAIDLENRTLLAGVVPSFQERLRFSFWDDLPAEELAGRLEDSTEGRLVFINGTVSDRVGEILPNSDAIKIIRDACPDPLYSLWDFFLGKGIVGGKLIGGREQGRLAARQALRILQGEDPNDIPVAGADANRFMFDYQELKRFGISMQRLPEGSLVINEPPPFYALSRGQLWTVLGLLTGLVAFLLVDVLLRIRAQRTLRAEKERVDLLLNSTAEAIYGVDPEGRCTFCNPATLRLLGYRDEKELLGKNLHALIHPNRPDGGPYPAEECRILQAFRQKEGLHVDDELLWRADGTCFPVEYWSYPIRRGPETIGAVVTFLDITERKQAAARMKEALRELDAFVYTVSHDLRSPLAAIIGFAEFLKGNHAEQLDGNARLALSEIEKQGERMTAMMEDLLALAQVGALPMPKEPVDVDAVVQEVLRELGSKLACAGLVVTREALPPARVPKTLLTQVFSNLIGNAIHYAGRDGGPIGVGGEREGEKVRFFVRDRGPGIPEEERRSIFDVFYRGSTGRDVSGTGVGLATVQKIGRLYDGRAWVEETPGGGSTFWIEMTDSLPGSENAKKTPGGKPGGRADNISLSGNQPALEEA